jgi:hypothetical protein
VIGLPLINGAQSQHRHNPYFPIPYSPGMLDGVPDSTAPQLIAQLTLADGSKLAPLAYFQHVQVVERGAETVITFDQPHLDRLGTDRPIPDDRLSVTSRYVISSGRITRTDVYTPKSTLDLKEIRMELATYSEAPTLKSSGTITFARGAVQTFSTSGFERCGTSPIQDDVAYHTTTGPLQTRVVCETSARTLQKPFELSWVLSYH